MCFFQAEDGIRDLVRSRGLGDVYKRQDLQWAFWDGVRGFYKKNEGYLQGQIGNPEGDEKPNKKYYDPRAWMRKGEDLSLIHI